MADSTALARSGEPTARQLADENVNYLMQRLEQVCAQVNAALEAHRTNTAARLSRLEAHSTITLNTRLAQDNVDLRRKVDDLTGEVRHLREMLELFATLSPAAAPVRRMLERDPTTGRTIGSTEQPV